MKQLTLLFLVRDKQILLAMKKRGFGAGRWNGVGGKLEAGESVEQALVRECQEEIKVTPLMFGQAADITFDEMHLGERELLRVSVFLCSEWSGQPTETEEMSPDWFNINQIPYKDMWADDIFWLPRVLKGEKLVCKFTLDRNDKIADKHLRQVADFTNTKVSG